MKDVDKEANNWISFALKINLAVFLVVNLVVRLREEY